MIKNFFSRTRRSKRWRARAEKMWTMKIFEDFFYYSPNLFIEDLNCHSIFAYNMRKVMILNRNQDINAWNQQDKSNENKSFFVVSFRNWLLKLKTRQLRVQMLVLFGVSRNSQTLLLFVLFGYFRFLLQHLPKYGNKLLIN